MKYKMVFLDLDDTLLDREHNISRKTVRTLYKLKEIGVEIAIATGRMFSSALPYIKQLKISGTVINYNGAYIKEVKRNKIIYHKPIDLEIAKEIIKEAEDADLYINIYIDDKLYISEINEKSEIYKKISQVEPIPVGKLSEYINASPTKMLITENDRKKVQDYISYFKEKYGGLIEVTQSKPYFIEIMSTGVSKGRAIKIVAEKLNIPIDQVIAIGDGYNDIEMLKTAGLGIAMGNAPAGVKKHADKITGKNDEEGVSSILSEIFSI